MSAGPPSRADALEAAGEAVRDARSTDRDAILDAQRVLRHAEKAHDRAVRTAEKHLHAEATDAARQALAAAHADRQGVAEARPLLDRVVGRMDRDEEILDMAAGISAGHDGVLVVTGRRVLFVAPRRMVDVPHEEIEALRVRGRHLGTRVTIVARGSKCVISGLSRVRAAEIAELLSERIGPHALR